MAASSKYHDCLEQIGKTAAKQYFPLMTKHLNELLHFGKGHNANLAMLLMRSIVADLNQGGLVDGD